MKYTLTTFLRSWILHICISDYVAKTTCKFLPFPFLAQRISFIQYEIFILYVPRGKNKCTLNLRKLFDGFVLLE